MVTATTISLVATTATAVAVALYFLSKNAKTGSSDVVPSKSPAPTPIAPPVPVPPPAESPTKNGHTTSAEIIPKKKKKKKIDVRVSGDEGGKERSKAESRVAPALIPEATSEGEPFVNSVVSRAILTQPADLLTAANPPLKASEKKKAKPKPISSWAAG